MYVWIERKRSTLYPVVEKEREEPTTGTGVCRSILSFFLNHPGARSVGNDRIDKIFSQHPSLRCAGYLIPAGTIPNTSRGHRQSSDGGSRILPRAWIQDYFFPQPDEPAHMEKECLVIRGAVELRLKPSLTLVTRYYIIDKQQIPRDPNSTVRSSRSHSNDANVISNHPLCWIVES